MSRKLWSELFNPTVVLDRMGKKATNQAQARRASLTLSIQMISSGAIATTGVTCMMTA